MLLPLSRIERYNKNAMKTLAEIKQILQAQKPYLAERYGVTEIGVFGSYVRGEQRPDSDLDILIEVVGLLTIKNGCAILAPDK
jgi:predicted nucleotidyltransferase